MDARQTAPSPLPGYERSIGPSRPNVGQRRPATHEDTSEALNLALGVLGCSVASGFSTALAGPCLFRLRPGVSYRCVIVQSPPAAIVAAAHRQKRVADGNDGSAVHPTHQERASLPISFSGLGLAGPR